VLDKNKVFSLVKEFREAKPFEQIPPAIETITG
jgi:hypothetical protein